MKWLCLFFILLGNNLSSQIIDSATLECGHSKIVTFRENPFVAQTYSWMVSEGVLVDHWDHCHECIRVTFSQSEKIVKEGIQIIADEVSKSYNI